MIFLRIRPGSRSSRSPSWAWKNCIIPSKHVKTLKQGSSAEFSCFTPRDCKPPQWNKPFLNRSIFPRCIESRCTEKNQARSLMTSTHASVRCSILVFTDIRRKHLLAALSHLDFGSLVSFFDYILLQHSSGHYLGVKLYSIQKKVGSVKRAFLFFFFEKKVDFFTK